ncbi:MAG: HDOD domain-containing protein [Methylococcales bacterium]|nr:HDOD domain-containing protein [Methylococcales bacterium]
MSSLISEQQMVTLVEQMPAFPNSVQRIIELTRDSAADPKELVKTIETDPIMTIKILKVVNSPYYGLSRKISSIQRAVVLIGVNTLKNLALSVASIGILQPTNPAGFDTRQFLKHSLATAALCKRLAEQLAIPAQSCGDYFVAGLLHDFGKIVYAQYLPEAFTEALAMSQREQCSLHHAEQAVIGIDHSQAGAFLAEYWAFDPILVEAINHHHAPVPEHSITQCLFAANQISKRVQIGNGGNPIAEAFPPSVIERFAMPDEQIQASLGDVSALSGKIDEWIS